MINDSKGTALLKPTDQGYSILQTDVGSITVRLDDIAPYADGTRARLVFGNTTSATLQGVSATLTWSSLKPNGDPDFTSPHTRQFRFEQSLSNGSWTSVPIVLDGLPPSQFGFVRITDFAHTSMLLRRH